MANDDSESIELPKFANAENRRLFEEFKLKEKALLVANEKIVDVQKRTQTMKEHQKNVQDELGYLQQLLEVKNKEMESEDHLKQMLQREIGRYNIDMKSKENVKKGVQTTLNRLRNSIFEGNNEIDEFKKQQEWEEEELEQWALAAAQKDDDNLALQRYTRSDEQKIKELTLTIERQTREVQMKKQELDEEVTRTLASQIELDRTAEYFKKIHKDRQDIIDKWSDTIETMKHRDDTVATAGEKYSKTKQLLTELHLDISEKQKRLENAKIQNRELENNIGIGDRHLSKFRTETFQEQESLADYQDEIEIMKNTLNKMAIELEKNKSITMNLASELENKKSRYDYSQREKNRIKSKLESQYSATDSLEKKMKHAEQWVKEEQQRLKEYDKKVSLLKEETFQKSQELFQLRQQEATLIAEIQGSQTVVKNLHAKIRKLDAQSLKQQELIYNQEYQIQQLERKLARAFGERTDEEKAVLNQKIEELQKMVEFHQKEEILLSNQMKKLDLDYRGAKRHITDLQTDQNSIQTKIVEISLDNETAEREKDKILKKKEESLVQESMMKLEIKRLRNLLTGKTDEAFGLTNRKYQLKKSMDEREQEIAVHKDMLRMQLKMEEIDRHKVAMEMRDRMLTVQKIKSKYEVVVSKLKGFGSNDENDGGSHHSIDGEEEHSQAYFVIKAAQEKEELQREGDEMDKQIQKLEKEISKLEKTFHSLSNENQNIRTMQSKVDPTSEVMVKKQALEQQHAQYLGQFRAKKRKTKELDEDIGDLQRAIDAAHQERESLAQNLDLTKQKKAQADKEMSDFNLKMERAQKILNKSIQTHHRKTNVVGNSSSDAEIEFRLQELREFQKVILTMLRKLEEHDPAFRTSLNLQLDINGLTNSQPPSRAMSVRSSVSITSRPASATSSNGSSSRGSIRSTHSNRSIVQR